MQDMAGRVSTVSLYQDDIMGAEQHCEYRLVKPGWCYGHSERGIVNTISLNLDEGMGAEDTG